MQEELPQEVLEPDEPEARSREGGGSPKVQNGEIPNCARV